MTDITLHQQDATFDYVEAEIGILSELAERFTFFAQNYKYHPKYKARVWDGKIRLLNPMRPKLYVGLRAEVKSFCDEMGYSFKVDSYVGADEEFSVKEAEEFLDTLNLPKEMNGIPFVPRDYQLEAFVRSIRKRRQTLICPTASGKSFIIYSIVRKFNGKTLIIVPSLGLIGQMKADFESYGYEDDIHQIFSGQVKQTNHQITVSTWQSLQNVNPKFLKQFDVLIVDEVHGAKAMELKKIIEAMTETEVRIGLTGTLDGIKANELSITGLLGPIHQVTTSKKLMDEGHLAALTIKSLVLEHTLANKKLLRKAKYPDEMKYLINSEARNNFIKNLALSLKGNTLVLFQFLEHGTELHSLISAESDQPVHYVSGEVDADEREIIRHFVNSQTQSITVASKGVFSTGTNIPNLDNIIFASPSKARIQTLQSIGRGLRKSNRKTDCTLFDIADDLSIGSWTNHTLNHYVERQKIYASEKFRNRSYQIQLKS